MAKIIQRNTIVNIQSSHTFSPYTPTHVSIKKIQILFLLDYNYFTFPAHINFTHRQNILSHQWKWWKNVATIGRSEYKGNERNSIPIVKL